MAEFILKGIVTEAGIATLQRSGTYYDYLEIAQKGGNVCRLHNVFVPASLQADIGPYAIGEFRCRKAEPGVSPAHEILDFRRADGAVTWPEIPVSEEEG
jgi:hypothetical protein